MILGRACIRRYDSGHHTEIEIMKWIFSSRWLFLVPVLLGAFPAGLAAIDDYVLSADSTQRRPGAPMGRVESFEFNQSEVFPGTNRKVWVYIPAQYRETSPAALMVFQDGHAYVSESGQIRVPIVFDNLIHAGEMPVTVGIFLNPGHRGPGAPAHDGWGNRNNRSFEYDTLSADYSKFLIDELIPHITKEFKLNLTDDPAMRAICGMSSGGICAFTAAWERPDYFHKVISHIGSFTNIRGGHVYPALIRKTERKNIRVFLQDGSNDLNNRFGSWPLANQQMAASLAFTGYDFKFVYGDGAHNGKHGGVIFPDSIRWLWRNEIFQSKLPKSQEILTSDSEWELVGEGYQFTDAACTAPDGSFLFSDLNKATLYSVPVNGSSAVPWLENGPKISGMKFGPDGMLYAATQGTDNEKKIVQIHPESKAVTTIATNVKPNDLVVSSRGMVYFTDTGAGTVVGVPTSARGLSGPSPVAGGITRPNGIGLSPDHKFLYVSEYGGVHVWAFMIADDGSLHSGERYMTLLKPNSRDDSGGDGMTVDSSNRAYITSHEGIQVMDETGRLLTVLSKPQDKSVVSCGFGGPGKAWLYVCNADKVYRRKTTTTGQ